MRYRNILVHLDCNARRSERLDLALTLAAQNDAQLTGLFSLDLYVGMPRAADAGSILVEAELKRRESCMRAAQAEFFDKLPASTARARWLSTEDGAVDELMLAARTADLVVIGQTDPATCVEDGVCATFAADAVLCAGKPVLIVPYAGHFESIGKRTLVAWNAAHEAERALTHALPVLERSHAVEVLSFDEGGEHHHADEKAQRAVQAFLAQRGVHATVKHCGVAATDPGAFILSNAALDAADCIVMGAYGQGRMNDSSLGGATRTVISSMTVPVFMSH